MSLGDERSCMAKTKLFCSSGALLVLLVVSMALPISMIIMGSIYIDSCPADRRVPVFFVVFGVFSVVITTLKVLTDCCSREENKNTCCLIILYAITFITGPFVFAWFIAGNVWIYRLRGQFSSDTSQSDYCDSTLYLYAYWTITSVYILTGAVAIVMAGVGCVLLWRKLATRY